MVWNFLIIGADMLDDVVYNIVKVVYDDMFGMLEGYLFFSYMIFENVLEIVILLHFGVICYFEEQGVDIPDCLWF